MSGREGEEREQEREMTRREVLIVFQAGQEGVLL